jgi:hypothetical protein
MTTTEHAASIRAAEARLAEAQADVDRLRAKLADELAEARALSGAEAGRAEAARRYPKKPTAAPAAKANDVDEPPSSGALVKMLAAGTAAEGQAAAQRRIAARKQGQRPS